MPTQAHAKNAARTIPILAYVRDELADEDEQVKLEETIEAVQEYRQQILDHDAEVPNYEVDQMDWRIISVAATNLDGMAERTRHRDELPIKLVAGREVLDEYVAELREAEDGE